MGRERTFEQLGGVQRSPAIQAECPYHILCCFFWSQVLAKDLVRTRNYVTKFIEFRSHLQGVGLKLETVRSHEAMAGAMKDVTKAMVSLNKQVSAECRVIIPRLSPYANVMRMLLTDGRSRRDMHTRCGIHSKRGGQQTVYKQYSSSQQLNW